MRATTTGLPDDIKLAKHSRIFYCLYTSGFLLTHGKDDLLLNIFSTVYNLVVSLYGDIV